MTTPTLYRPTDDAIIDALADGVDAQDVVAAMIDADVAAGDYDGCSSDLEIAHADYTARVDRIVVAVGGIDR
jgi:hypothetical protein